MTDAGVGLGLGNPLVTEDLVLMASLFTPTVSAITWLVVSCLTRCATSVAILGAVALITLSAETAVATSLTN